MEIGQREKSARTKADCLRMRLSTTSRSTSIRLRKFFMASLVWAWRERVLVRRGECHLRKKSSMSAHRPAQTGHAPLPPVPAATVRVPEYRKTVIFVPLAKFRTSISRCCAQVCVLSLLLRWRAVLFGVNWMRLGKNYFQLYLGIYLYMWCQFLVSKDISKD